MEKPICPKCGSDQYARERRPNGDTTCLTCGYKAPSKEWDASAPQFVAFRETLETVIETEFHKTIEDQRGVTADDFLDNLRKSTFFKGLFGEAFTKGMNYGAKLKESKTP